MKYLRITATSAAAGATLVIASGIAASADDLDPVEQVAQRVSVATEDTSPLVAIGLPVDISRDAEVADDGPVVYQAETTKPAVDVAAQILEDGSVRVQTVIDTPATPHEFAYPLTLPAGASLSLTDDGGVIAIDADGVFLARVRAPWARDAQGDKVATSYRIDGNTIVQTVATVADQRCPVVADPWLRIALVDKVTRATVSGKGYRYSVYPTWWARAGAGYGARWARPAPRTRATGRSWPVSAIEGDHGDHAPQPATAAPLDRIRRSRDRDLLRLDDRRLPRR